MNDNSITKLISLDPLSRDHGIVLVCAHLGRKAIRATRDNRLELLAKMRVICLNEIVPHLEDEQWILSPFIGDKQLRAEFHKRHRDIRQLASELCQMELTNEPGLGLISRLANALDDYVRWEENTLFPRIVEGIERNNLQQLFKLTSSMEKIRVRGIPMHETTVVL